MRRRYFTLFLTSTVLGFEFLIGNQEHLRAVHSYGKGKSFSYKTLISNKKTFRKNFDKLFLET